MNEIKLTHELFIGKVAGEIGFDKTVKLLKEAKEAIKPLMEGQCESEVMTKKDKAEMLTDFQNFLILDGQIDADGVNRNVEIFLDD